MFRAGTWARPIPVLMCRQRTRTRCTCELLARPAGAHNTGTVSVGAGTGTALHGKRPCSSSYASLALFWPCNWPIGALRSLTLRAGQRGPRSIWKIFQPMTERGSTKILSVNLAISLDIHRLFIMASNARPFRTEADFAGNQVISINQFDRSGMQLVHLCCKMYRRRFS